MTYGFGFCYHSFMDSFRAMQWQWEMGATDFVAKDPVAWTRKQATSPPPPFAPLPALPAALPASLDLSVITNLDALRDVMAGFNGLEIRQAAKQMVFGEGVVPPRVLFIGEAPGEEEDAQGRPFVGVAGQLLDKMMAAIQLSRTENAYITNVLPWRPPGNRPPTPQETALSMPFVRKHIALLRPEFMVVMGGTAARAVLDVTEGITRVRGQWRDYLCETGRNIPTLILFHPAYLLRTPAQKAPTWQDLLALKSRLTPPG